MNSSHQSYPRRYREYRMFRFGNERSLGGCEPLIADASPPDQGVVMPDSE